MKRFIPVSLAILLGLVSSTKVISDSNLFLQSTEASASASSSGVSATVKEWTQEASEDLARLNCLLYNDLTFFDLRALEKGNTYTYLNYHFNFCQRLKDESGRTTFAYFDQASNMKRLTDGNRPVSVTAVLNEDTNKRHISYEMKGGENCPLSTNSPKDDYSVFFEITCDSSITDAPVLGATNVDLTDPCRPQVRFAHKVGCPVFEATSIVRYLSENPYVLGAILIVFGSIVTFYGGLYFPWVLATLVGGVTFLVCLLFCSIFGLLVALDKGKGATGGEIALAVLSFLVSGGLGVLAGLFIKAVRRYGLMLLGGTAGFFLGFLLYTFVFAQWAKTVYLLSFLCFTGFVAGAYLTYKFDKALIVYLTAFIGAYSLIRGISMFAGKYPNEIFIYQQLSNGAFDGLTWEFYAYFASMVVTGILGVLHQRHKGYHEHHHDDDYKQA